MNEYWHTPKTMPQSAKNQLSTLAQGAVVAVLTNELGEQVPLLKVSGAVFSQVFALNREYLFRGDFTAPVTENAYAESDNYLTQNGLAGFAVTKDGWLVSLFSNQPWRGFAKLVAPYIPKHATKLECLTTQPYAQCALAQMYAKRFGFKLVAETVDDEAAMRQHYGDAFVDEFVQCNGQPHHLFMVRTPAALPAVQKFTDYWAAYDYVNSLLPKGKLSCILAGDGV